MFSSLFFQKLKYHLRAKNLHGVHSPFVYHFNDKVLNGEGSEHQFVYFTLWKQLNLDQKQSAILDRMCTHYSISTVCFLGQKFEIAHEIDAGRLLVFEELGQVPIIINPNDIIIVISPYRSKENFLAWQNLIEDLKVPLSIDIFKMGLLFFRKEFLVKQYFTLKC